jgi:hypothetical protein
MGNSYGYVVLLMAIFFSGISRRRSLTKNFKHSFVAAWILEEEANCFVHMFMMIFCGPVIRPFFMMSILIWIFINICNWGSQILDKNPEAIGLTPLAPVFAYTKLHVVDLVKMKHYIEVAIILSSIFGWLFGMCMPFFAIVAV